MTENKLEIRDYYAEGTADSNHLEKGLWKFYGLENHNLCQEGFFLNGVRVGLWKYYFPFKDSIFWVQYYSKDSSIRTNVPVYLSTDTDEGKFVAFAHDDTSKLLLLKIGIAENIDFDLAEYHKAMLQEVKNNSLKVNSNSCALVNTTCDRVYHYNKFTGIDKNSMNYTLLTINSVLSDSLLIEVTVRYRSDNIHLGEETFFSVMSNLFIKGNRFFDENIDCEIIRNKVVRRKRSFLFGCNNLDF
ncbi:MAG: hypothetical protein J0M30_15155 [Chitinophagales bacterium]|nr:hypothetical protein [Chitinophagales bacterium]